MAFHSIPLPIAQLSLPAVVKCGQSFRWSVLTPAGSKTPVEYRLCLKDRIVCLRQSSDTLFYRSVFPGPEPPLDDHAEREAETLKWLRNYFQLDIDLVALYKQWAGRDPVFAKIQERFEGIRMLRQDPWENLVSSVLPLYPCAGLVHKFFDPGLYALLITI
jgi:N-glycosylase/DNA lyase